MPGYINEIESASGNVGKINAAGERAVALSALAENAGFAKILDSQGKALLVTEHGYLNVSEDDLIFVDQVDGANLNTNKWLTSVSGMTVVQASGYITLNSGGAVTTGAYAILQSIRSIPMFGYLPLRVVFNGLATVLPQPNSTIELGIGTVAGTSTPTDGCYFRWGSDGNFKAIINNGSETASVPFTPPPINDATLFEIIIVEDLVQFLIDDEIVAEVEAPVAISYPTNSGRLPLFARVYNGGTSPSIAPKLALGQVVVVQQGLSQSKPWSDILNSLGLGAYQSPLTPFGQNANHANSTSPASATLSNTTPGYTTLGGRYQFVAPAGAATDFALFGFQVPAGYQLYIKGIMISAMNMGAAVAVTPTILDWFLGINASAASLATADGAGTWAPRRVPLGMQSFATLGAIGLAAPDIVRVLDPPFVIDGGRYVHIGVQIPVGTATISQIIRGDVMINGYFE